jgi:hypothetical protein
MAKKGELEITILRWDYEVYTPNDAMCGRFRWDERSERGDPQYYLPLLKHDCPFQRGCGLFLEAVEIALGSDRRGKCELLHSKGVKTHTSHEFELLKNHLPPLFRGDEAFSIGGGGITSIDFVGSRGKHLTDAGMDIYKKLLPLFDITDERDIQNVRGPAVFRKNYFWSIDLQGWIAFEDRLALSHGLRPINGTRGSWSNQPIQTFQWP